MDQIRQLWHGFLNYVARHSPVYKELKKGVVARELGLEIGELELELKRLEEERALFQINYESASEYADDAEQKAEEARKLAGYERALRRVAENEMAKAKHQVAELISWKSCAIPLAALFNLLGTSQSAALYVNADDYVLFANKEATAQVRRRCGKKKSGLVEGRSLWEITSSEFMKRFREDLMLNPNGFQVGYGHFINWYAGVARDNDKQIYGYTITHERGLVRKILQLFLPEQEATKRLVSHEGLLIPGEMDLVTPGN